MAVGAGATGWVQPTNLVDTAAELNVVRQPHGQIFNTISNGIRTMPAYQPADPGDGPLEDRALPAGHPALAQRLDRRRAAEQAAHPQVVPWFQELVRSRIDHDPV